MPKITVHGGATNEREATVGTPVPTDGQPRLPELIRDEDHPTAPAGRPGEHAAFFAEGRPADYWPDEQPADEQPADEQPVDEQPVDEQPAGKARGRSRK